MSYENAPATRMLATHCTACGKPLLDADSITAGLGPVCRKAARSIPEEVRERANKVIYECAREDVTVEQLQACVIELHLLGCNKIAERISKRAGRQVITITADAADVTAPYSETFLRHRGPGRWVRSERVTRYHLADAYKALTAVRAAFGEACLVRLELGGEVTFFRADDDRLDGTIAGVAADAPAKPEPASPCPSDPSVPPKWSGKPARVGTTWGVCLNAAGHLDAPNPGDRVTVRARSGKTWVATLAEPHRTTRWGAIWTTIR